MPHEPAARHGAVHFECVVPILRVNDLGASEAYYVGVLGFKVDWRAGGEMISVSRDGRALMLCKGCQGNPGTWVWLGVSDAEQLYSEFKSKGAKFRLSPTNYPWAYEIQVLDPDGHVLRFGSEPLSDLPV